MKVMLYTNVFVILNAHTNIAKLFFIMKHYYLFNYQWNNKQYKRVASHKLFY